jgi:tellurite resistance protein
MHSQDMAIVKSLVSVAWADGTFADKEKEMIDALLEAFQASAEQAKEVQEYAKTRKTLDDLPWDELSPDDCRVLLQHAVLLTFVDGEQGEDEKKFVHSLCEKLGLPEKEASNLVELAETRAKRYLSLL